MLLNAKVARLVDGTLLVAQIPSRSHIVLSETYFRSPYSPLSNHSRCSPLLTVAAHNTPSHWSSKEYAAGHTPGDARHFTKKAAFLHAQVGADALQSGVSAYKYAFKTLHNEYRNMVSFYNENPQETVFNFNDTPY
jgi:hypothetical protein